MANRYGRPFTTRARQRAINRKRLLIGGGAVAALLVIVLVILILPKGGTDRTVEAVQYTQAPSFQEAADESEATVAAAADEVAEPTATPEPTPEPTQAPAAQAEADPMRVQSRPTPIAEGFLPVFSSANTEEKIVAITVDDCFQAENLEQIVNKAIEVGAKLTIFPIGKNALKEKQSQILKYAWENGFELENHTFSHSGLFNISNEELAEEIYKQQLALSYILGVEYHCHFLRPRGGDARNDQRMQAYANQMGYYGIAHWSVDGKYDNAKIAKGLKPGAIFLFHTTNTDLEKLLEFIPWVASKGYQMVTLNEMFGYPANEYSELTTPISEHTIPPLEPYEMVYVKLKKTAYCWEAYVLQEKLIALGYLSGEPDGVYGGDCEEAIKKYQKDHGMEQTGVADPDLLREIIEGTAT